MATKHIWTVRNTTIGNDAGLGYYTSKAEAVESIRCWLTDKRVTIVTPLDEIDLRSRKSEDVMIVVHNLCSHKHQILEIERHYCNNGSWMVQTLRQGQDAEPADDNVDQELENAKAFAKKAEAAMDNPDDEMWESTSAKALLDNFRQVQADDVTVEQDVARALAMGLEHDLQNDRKRVQFHHVVCATASHLKNFGGENFGNMNFNDRYEIADRIILERVQSEAFHLEHRALFSDRQPVADRRELGYRFLATVEEHLPEKAYLNWDLKSVKAFSRKDPSKLCGYSIWLQLQRH